MLQLPKIAVLLGGRSAEREVSLNSGRNVAEALSVLGYDVVEVDTGREDFIERLKAEAPDVAFICLHGRFGEDGTIQGLLELLDIPYVGSGVLASATAIDKVLSKRLYESIGLKTPEWLCFREADRVGAGEIVARLGQKVVVKPASEGSTIGLSIVQGAETIEGALDEAFAHDDQVLVEAFMPGVEVTVGVIGNQEPAALPTLEIVPKNDYYDYEAKYVPGMSEHIIPARVSEEARAECQRLSIEAHKVLGCCGMSRSDTIVTDDGQVFLLETNTIPGMTATSLLPDAARAAGIEFPQLCEKLVALALEGWHRVGVAPYLPAE